jgi:hypothetical protein
VSTATFSVSASLAASSCSVNKLGGAGSGFQPG